MNLSRTSVVFFLLHMLLILVLWPVSPASADPIADSGRPDYATITMALDGDPGAIESLSACADRDSDCRMIAAAARHRQRRTEAAVELLRPLLERGNPRAARIVAELAFELDDYRLAWAAGSLWLEANGQEPPADSVADRGMRTAWLMGRSASALSAAELDTARRMAEELRAGFGTASRIGGKQSPSAQRPPYPDAISRAAPKFPREMSKAGAGGWAISVFSVAPDGKVDDVRGLFASNTALAKSSIEAIDQWRFEPTEDGEWWTQQTIDFNLGGRRPPVADADSGIPDEQGWIAFDHARGWIEFTVRVNGLPARAMLDSGADGNAISRRLVEEAGIELNLLDEVRVQGVYDQEVVPTAGEFDMRFGSATVPLRGATVLPMSSPDLILGVGLFQASVVQIDYPNERIRFLNRDVVNFESNLRVRTERGRSPQVMAELGGKSVWMLLDTGNAGTTLFKRRLLQRLDFDEYVVDGADISGFGAVSGGRKRLLQLPGFELGPFPFESLLASYIEEGGKRGFEGRRAGYGSRIRSDTVPFDGILGYEVLKNFIVTTDLRNRKIHLALP